MSLLVHDDSSQRNSLLSFGAELLDLFCRLNWTGPPLTSDEEKLLAGLSKFREESLEILSWDSEVGNIGVLCYNDDSQSAH